jgi:hypothetical protein
MRIPSYVTLTLKPGAEGKMKQAELAKLLNAALRESGKKHQWKCSRGFVFRATELLFFSIIVVGQAKQRQLSGKSSSWKRI